MSDPFKTPMTGVRARMALWRALNPDDRYSEPPDEWRPDPQDAARLSEIYVFSHENVGRKSVALIRAWLNAHGLDFRR